MFDNLRVLHLLSHVSDHCSGFITEESVSMTFFVRVDLLGILDNRNKELLLLTIVDHQIMSETSQRWILNLTFTINSCIVQM